jgi:ABC-type Fe3+-hydroxamate transport system substrate-binding protein
VLNQSKFASRPKCFGPDAYSNTQLFKKYSQVPNKQVYSLNYFGLFYTLLALIVNLLD